MNEEHHARPGGARPRNVANRVDDYSRAVRMEPPMHIEDDYARPGRAMCDSRFDDYRRRGPPDARAEREGLVMCSTGESQSTERALLRDGEIKFFAERNPPRDVLLGVRNSTAVHAQVQESASRAVAGRDLVGAAAQLARWADQGRNVGIGDQELAAMENELFSDIKAMQFRDKCYAWELRDIDRAREPRKAGLAYAPRPELPHRPPWVKTTAPVACSVAPGRFEGLLVATRLHVPDAGKGLPTAMVEHLRTFARSAVALGAPLAIAVNSHEDEVRLLAREAAPGLAVTVLPVPCWGEFTPSLNALLGHARREGFVRILFMSLEVRCGPEIVECLIEELSDQTLVVGAALFGHSFLVGEQLLKGRTAPWNTLALWSVRKLSLTGFLSIADGLPNTDTQSHPHATPRTDGLPEPVAHGQAVPAGVESCAVISVQQKLFDQCNARAVLLHFPPEMISWDTNWPGDPARQDWHDSKMALKETRPQAQLEQLFPLQPFDKGVTAAKLVDGGATADRDARQFGVVSHIHVHLHGKAAGPPYEISSRKLEVYSVGKLEACC